MNRRIVSALRLGFCLLRNVLVSDCSRDASASARVCLMFVFVHGRVCAAGWWRCSSYIICISLPHSDREEGGSCRLPSRHLQPAEASLLSSSPPLPLPLSPSQTQRWFHVHPVQSTSSWQRPQTSTCSRPNVEPDPPGCSSVHCMCFSELHARPFVLIH